MRLPGWVRTLGLWLATIAGLMALAFVARRQVVEAVAAVVDFVSPARKRGWLRVIGDPARVDVLQPDGPPVRVKLPEGITADDLRAIGASREGWSVEVVHTARNRRAALR